MSLKDRCEAFYKQIKAGESSPADLIGFVIAEKGRAANSAFEDKLPLCIYFANDKDREEFIQVLKLFNPALIEKKLP